MASANFNLECLLDDAQDLEEESLVARALLQPETNPWESFPLTLLYPTEEPFNEIHYSLFCDLPADSLLASEPPIETEPTEDTALLSTVSQPQCDFELAEYLNFTHEDLAIASPTTTVLSSSSPIEDSDAPLPQSEPELAEHLCFNAQLEYLDTSISLTTTISSSSSPTEPVERLYFSPPQLDYSITTADYNSFSITDTNPTTTISLSPPSFSSFRAPTASPTTTIVSPSSSSLSAPFPSTISSDPTSSCSSELSSSNAPSINTEDVPCSTVPLDEASDSVKPSAEPEVHYTFVDPHEKPRKRRAKGIKNSTPIACTFCRRRKIRCGGPQQGGEVCKSCIRLNHKGECVFPAVSYRGQRLGGLNSKRKPTCKSKSTAKCALPPSKSS